MKHDSAMSIIAIFLSVCFSNIVIAEVSPETNPNDTDLAMTHIDIFLKTDFQSNTVDTVVTVFLKNSSPPAVNQTEFYLCPKWNDPDIDANLNRMDLLDDDVQKELEFECRRDNDPYLDNNDLKVYQVSFPKAIESGETRVIRFDYTIVGKPDFSSTPIALAYDGEGGKELYLRGPDWRWLPTFYKKNERPSQEASTWTMRIEYPAGYIGVVDGDLVKREEIDGVVKDMWVSLRNSTPNVFIGQYQVEKRTRNGLTLEVYTTNKERLMKARDRIDDYIQMFDLYAQWYGHPGPSTYRIVGGGTEWSRSGGTGMVMGQTIDKRLLDNIELIGHEMAHTWWSILFDFKGEGYKFITEAMAEFSMNYVLGAMGKERSVYDNMMRNIKVTNFCHYYVLSSPPNLYPLIEQEGFDTQGVERETYRKGPLVLNQIRLMFGDEVFFQSLKVFQLRYRNKRADIHDFVDTVSHVAGKDISADLKNLLWSAGYPSYRLLGYESTKSSDGYRTKVKIQNVGDYGLDCSLLLITNQNEKRVLFNVSGKEEGEFVYTTDKKVIDAVIDPDQTAFQYHPEQKVQIWKTLDLNTPPFKGGKMNWVWFGKSYMFYSLGDYENAIDTITNYFCYDMKRSHVTSIKALVEKEGIDRPYLFMRGIYQLVRGDNRLAEKDIKTVFPYLLADHQVKIMYLTGAIQEESLEQYLDLLSLIAGREFSLDESLDEQAKLRKIEEWKQWWEHEGKLHKLDLSPLKERFEAERQKFRKTLGLSE